MSTQGNLPVTGEATGDSDGATKWPADAFTRAVTAVSRGGVDTPAVSSYADDANMESVDAMPPFSSGAADETDLARYTGATGGARS